MSDANVQRTKYRLKSGERSPLSKLKRLWCMECAQMRDARRVGRSPEYTLDPCGHKRLAVTSEKIQDRIEEIANDKAHR
jgi:hypothetical protein